MARFEVFVNAVLVGHSELEFGDPPMGVAFGRFLPLPAYYAIQPTVIAAKGGQLEQMRLSVCIDGGAQLQCSGGVHLVDHSVKGHEEIEVSVLGVNWPQYEEVFPAHIETYAAQFK